MGLRFLDSLFSLLTAACVVFAAYFVGHALSSEHGGWAWITAAVLLVLGVALGFLTTRRIRSYARRPGHASGDVHAHEPGHGIH